MNPNRKVLFTFVSFFLVIVTIACSCSSLSPSGSTTPSSSSGSGSTPAATGQAGPTATIASSVPAAPASSGPPYIEQASAQTTVPAGESAAAVAACPTGSLMLGGGFASAQGLQVIASMPDPTGWLVTGLNDTAGALTLTAYASCLHNADGTIQVVSAQVPVSGAPIARCPAGEIVTGGGYADGTGSLEVYISTPLGDSNTPGNAWSVMAHPDQNADEPITVYAVCLSGSSLTSTLIRDDKVTYGSGADALNFTMTCPSGAVMASGGYEGTGAYISRVNSTDTTIWEVQVQGKIYFDGSLDHAVCLNLP